MTYKAFRIIIVFLSILFTTNSVKLNAQNKPFSAGISKIKTTPTQKTPMDGYSARTENFKGIHDDLFARTIVLHSGNVNTVIISIDFISIPFEFWENISKQIEQKTGIPKDNIFLCATHTHDGPQPVNYYIKELSEKILISVKEAKSSLKPARIGAGKGICKMNINRRGITANGNIYLGRNPYKPVDQEVGVIKIEDLSGNPMSIIINWGTHSTVMGQENYLISGDWPGATSRYIENEFGQNIIAPVFIGADGDVAPIHSQTPSFNSRIGEVDIIGITLGEEVSRIIKEIKTSSHCSIEIKHRFLTLSGKKPTDLELFNKKGISAFEPGQDVNLHLTVLKLGSIIFAGSSAQLFANIGLQIKSLSPYKYTFVVDHCNGTSGYIPTDDAYKEGGYEVCASKVMKGGEKSVIENILDLISEF